MSTRSRASRSAKKTEVKSELGKRRAEADVGPAQGKAPTKKATKAAAPIPQRRNIEELDEREYQRYAIAIQRLMAGAAKGANTDWWNLNSIHGGGWGTAVANEIKPLMVNYLRDYPNDLHNSWDDPAKVDSEWMKMGFCAHTVPTFMIWHRVYMMCFEILLQKYDPAPESETPLMAHYWHWDSPKSKSIPDRFTQDTIYDPWSKKDVPNPLKQGVSNEPDRQYTIRGIPHPGVSPYAGLKITDLDQAYRSMSESDYSQVVTQNNDGGAFSFEEPHNMLHNSVGGYNADDTKEGDMCDVPNSSFDPIFWAHHSNVERMHFAWLATHPVPTELVFNEKGRTQADMTESPLWPFPQKDKLTYENLPWKTGKGGAKLVPSKVNDWWDNSQLNYGYDNIKDVGAPALKAKVPKDSTKVRVILRNIYVRGSGLLHATVRVGDHEVTLAPRAIFTARAKVPCPNCDARRLALGWEVVIPTAALTAAAAPAPTGKKAKKGTAASAAAAPEAEIPITVVSLALNKKPLDSKTIVEATCKPENA